MRGLIVLQEALCASVINIIGCRFLRSATQDDLVVPVVRTSTLLHKSFAVVGSSFWTRLPGNFRNKLLGLSLPLFRKRLKTIIFDDRGLVFARWGRPLMNFLEVALYKFRNENFNQPTYLFHTHLYKSSLHSTMDTVTLYVLSTRAASGIFCHWPEALKFTVQFSLLCQFSNATQVQTSDSPLLTCIPTAACFWFP